ncbi:MAG: helix-turn-helix domain-containing protein [Lachnospiraceae bacterium]|nr:helix-turn-helix domain-containing protein [Lachnospiraceae bacterium]
MEGLQISLAAARVNAGLTQDDVARELHINKQTIVNWEKGISEPKISQGKALSKLYSMPLDCIIFLPSESN